MNDIKLTGGFVLSLITAAAASLHLASYNSAFAGNPAEYLSYLKGGAFLIRLLITFIIVFPALLFTQRLIHAPEPGRFGLAAPLACLILTPIIIAFKYDRILMLSLNNMLFFFSAFIFILPALNKKKSREDEKNHDTAFFIAAAAVLGLFSFYCTYSAHLAFNTATDLAIFANTIWLSANSLPAVTWLEGSLGTADRLGVHFQPFIYVFTPFFKNSAPVWLLLSSQAAAAYGSAIFIYLLGREIFPDKKAAFITGLAYLSSFFLIRSIDFDFHLTPFFSLFFLAFIYFSEKSSFVPAAGALILAAATREDSSIYLAAASVFFYFRNRCPVYIFFAVLSAAYAAVVNLLIMPSFSSHASTHGARALSDFFSFFSSVKPAHTADFIAYYLLPIAFIPLLRISSASLILLPAVAVYLPASSYYNTLFFYQYHAMVLPALFVSFIYACEKLEKLSFKIPLLPLSLFVFFMQAAVHFAWAPAGGGIFWYIFGALILIILPFSLSSFSGRINSVVLAASAILIFFSGYYTYNNPKFKQNPLKTKAFVKITGLIPSAREIPVIASVNLVSRFSARKYVSDPAYYVGSAETLANRVIRTNASELYMVLDRNGSLSFNADKEFRTASEFAALLLKNGYTGLTLGDSYAITAVKFTKAGQK